MNVEPVKLIIVPGVAVRLEDFAPPQQAEIVYCWSPCPRHITWGAGARRAACKRPGRLTPDGRQFVVLDEYLSEVAAR